MTAPKPRDGEVENQVATKAPVNMIQNVSIYFS